MPFLVLRRSLRNSKLRGAEVAAHGTFDSGVPAPTSSSAVISDTSSVEDPGQVAGASGLATYSPLLPCGSDADSTSCRDKSGHELMFRFPVVGDSESAPSPPQEPSCRYPLRRRASTAGLSATPASCAAASPSSAATFTDTPLRKRQKLSSFVLAMENDAQMLELEATLPSASMSSDQKL